MSFTRLALAALLALGPTVATAQTPDAEDEVPQEVLQPRVEIAGTAGLAIAFPEFGLLASVPIEKDSAIEVAVSRMPPVWDAPTHVLAQVQVRVPFRERLRSRKSFLLGLTSISALAGDSSFLGLDSGSSFVRPHAGVSLQWPVAPTLDFRFDAQGIFTFVGEFPLLPRGVTALVWHPRAARSDRANNRRITR